jgi:hypothetical protein
LLAGHQMRTRMSAADKNVCPTDAGSAADKNVCPTDAGSAADKNVCPTDAESAADKHVCPTDAGSAADKNVCPTGTCVRGRQECLPHRDLRLARKNGRARGDRRVLVIVCPWRESVQYAYCPIGVVCPRKPAS